MKIRLLLVAFVAAVLACPPAFAAGSSTKALAITTRPPEHEERGKVAEPDKRIIEDFKKYRDGQFPTWWRSWPLQRDKVKKIYHVKVEGDNHFLRAEDDKDISQQIMKSFIWPIDEMPYLNWRWRPRILPAGATEADDTRNDSACGVYVIFGRYSGVATKYAWSTSLPVGSVVSRRGGKLKIDIVDTGQGGVGQWHDYSVNVPQSYRKLFGTPMNRKPTGVAVLTDGNATHTAAACDYADFVISKKPLH